MIEQLEALFALSREGTMGKAGIALRLSQSAVSKRIANLEERLGRNLVEKQGRQSVLTLEGTRLLQSVEPLLSELHSVLRTREAEGHGRVILGVSESILASWGAALLAQVRSTIPAELEIHAHRSPVVVERVRSGEYMAGFCAGYSENAPDLEAIPVLEEPMVLLPSRLSNLDISQEKNLKILTIEPRSSTWQSIERRVKKLGMTPSQTLESFFAIAQVAREGFGHGLVPIGVAQALKIPSSKYIRFPAPGLQRPVSFVARRSTLSRPLIETLKNLICENASHLFERKSR